MKVSFLLYSIITLVSSHIVMAYNVYLMLLTLLWPTRTTFESPTTATAAAAAAASDFPVTCCNYPGGNNFKRHRNQITSPKIP